MLPGVLENFAVILKILIFPMQGCSTSAITWRCLACGEVSAASRLSTSPEGMLLAFKTSTQ